MHGDRQTDERTDGRTDGLKQMPPRKYTKACIDGRTHVRSNIWTHEYARRQTDRRTDGQTDGRTLTYVLTHARMDAHERWNAYTHTGCTQVHTIGRIDKCTHVRKEANTQVQTWKLEIRSLKLEIINVARPLMNARILRTKHLDARTCALADRQTDGQTEGRTNEHKHNTSRTRACKHTNACIDERTHVRSNIWTHELASGQPDRQTDGRTDSHIRPHVRAHAYTRTLHAYTHARCTQIHTHGRIDLRTHVRTETNIQVLTWKL